MTIQYLFEFVFGYSNSCIQRQGIDNILSWMPEILKIILIVNLLLYSGIYRNLSTRIRIFHRRPRFCALYGVILSTRQFFLMNTESYQNTVCRNIGVYSHFPHAWSLSLSNFEGTVGMGIHHTVSLPSICGFHDCRCIDICPQNYNAECAKCGRHLSSKITI